MNKKGETFKDKKTENLDIKKETIENMKEYGNREIGDNSNKTKDKVNKIERGQKQERGETTQQEGSKDNVEISVSDRIP